MYMEDAPMELGQTLSGTSAVGSTLINLGKLGMHYEFPAVPIGNTALRGNKGRLTGHPIVAVLLRNTSGAALLPQRVGKLDETAGYDVLHNCAGYADTLADDNVVVIDDLLPSAGVADDDIFWGIISGPQHILLPTVDADHNLAISAHNPVVAATGSTTGNSTSGRISNVTIVGQTGGTEAFNMARNLLGTALSASTTAQTGGVTVLVNVQIGSRL